jgi:hypothetical protein
VRAVAEWLVLGMATAAQPGLVTDEDGGTFVGDDLDVSSDPQGAVWLRAQDVRGIVGHEFVIHGKGVIR